MSYLLSKKAEEDVIAIYLDGASEFGVQRADQYHQQLKKTFQFLSDNPEAAHLRHELVPAVRIHPCQSHMVIYTVNEDRDAFIIRIRHQREDWLR